MKRFADTTRSGVTAGHCIHQRWVQCSSTCVMLQASRIKHALRLCLGAMVLSLTIDQPKVRAVEPFVGSIEVLLAGQAGQRQSRNAHSLKPQHLQIAQRGMMPEDMGQKWLHRAILHQSVLMASVATKAIMPTRRHELTTSSPCIFAAEHICGGCRTGFYRQGST